MPAEMVAEVRGREASGAGLTLELVSTFAALQTLEPEWRTLARSSAPENFFSSYEWAQCWWESYGDGLELFVLLCRDDRTKTLVGIAPFYRIKMKGDVGLSVHSLRLIGDGSDDVDGFGIISEHGRERECVRTVLAWLGANSREWDLLELNSMPEESTCTRELFAQVRELGWVEQMKWTPHLIVELGRTWEEYLGTLSAKVRQTWLRKLRHTQKDFVVKLRRCESRAGLAADLETVFALHQARWRALGFEGKLADAKRQKFYHLISEIALQAGNLDLWLLELDGVPRAARLDVRAGKTRHGLLAGMDPEVSALGPGTVIDALVFKECIAHGAEVYDVLSGEDEYKFEYSATRRRYMNLSVARPRTRTGLWLKAQGTVRDSKQWMRSHMPATYRAFRKMTMRGE